MSSKPKPVVPPPPSQVKKAAPKAALKPGPNAAPKAAPKRPTPAIAQPTQGQQAVHESLSSLLVKVASLTEDPANARKHGPRNLDAIKASLHKFGQRKPIVVQKEGMIVRAGNGTLAAAKALGWTEIAAVVIDEPSKLATQFAIADNRTAEMAEWDIGELLSELKSFELDDVVDLGFDQDDMDNLLDMQVHPFVTMRMKTSDLRSHPKNYQRHPEDQIAHIIKSIETHGFYRNVVVANDNTILAGHGVVEAATKMGKTMVPVIKLNIASDDPRAIKVMTSDNEIQNLAEVDDRALTELLRELAVENSVGLDGTGFNQQQLSALVFTTRPGSEVASKQESEAWVGMPAYHEGSAPIKLIVSFECEADRADFAAKLGIKLTDASKSLWWPVKEMNDLKRVAFDIPGKSGVGSEAGQEADTEADQDAGQDVDAELDADDDLGKA